MSMAIRLPRRPTIDFSYGAVRSARSSVARVQSRREEVAKVAKAVETFTERHLLVVHVQEKPDNPDKTPE